MQVNPSGNSNAVHRIATQQAQAVPRGPTDSASLGRFDTLKAELRDLPDVRETEVARAKALAEKPPYPPAETVRRIANLLATNIKEGAH